MAKRILVVDDDASMRTILRLTLEKVAGYTVFTANCGREGLLRASDEHPDAILLDVMMPDLDGIATFKCLQANPVTQDIPVILVTAKQQPADLARFAQTGVRGVIAKPFDPVTLPGEIAAILGWSR